MSSSGPRVLRTLLAALLLGLGALLLQTSPAAACSCVRAAEDPALVEQADVVFVGTAVADRAVGSTRFLTFAVDRVHKGEAAARQRLRTSAQSPACGVSVTLGGSYVVQAAGTARDLSVDACGGTRPGRAVAGLGDGSPPRPGTDGPSPWRGGPVVTVLVGGLLLGLAGGAALVVRRRRSARPEG